MLLFKGTKVCQRSTQIIELYSRSHIWKLCTVEYFFPGTMATRSEDYYKEDDEDSYNYKKTILKMLKMKTGEDEENEDSEEEDHSDDEENR